MLIFLLHWRSYKVLKAYVKAYCKIKIKFFWRLRHKPSVVLARKYVLSPSYMSNVAFGSRSINIPKTDPIHQERMPGRGLESGQTLYWVTMTYKTHHSKTGKFELIWGVPKGYFWSKVSSLKGKILAFILENLQGFLLLRSSYDLKVPPLGLVNTPKPLSFVRGRGLRKGHRMGKLREDTGYGLSSDF